MEKNGKVMVPKKAAVRRLPKGARRAVYVASVRNNHRCSGLYLEQALGVLHKKGIQETIIMLCDSPQAHNLKTTPEPTPEDWQESKKMGDDWLVDNGHILKQSLMKISVVRLHDLSHTPEYRQEVQTLIRETETDPELGATMQDTIEEFQRRNSAMKPMNCFGFLTEELPLIRRFATEKFEGDWVDAMCYPGSIVSVLKHVIATANQQTEGIRPAPMPFCNIEFSLTAEPVDNTFTPATVELLRAIEVRSR